MESLDMSINNDQNVSDKQAVRASFKTSHFGRSLRWVKILILEILYVFLRLNFSSALTLTKLKRFESSS